MDSRAECSRISFELPRLSLYPYNFFFFFCETFSGFLRVELNFVFFSPWYRGGWYLRFSFFTFLLLEAIQFMLFMARASLINANEAVRVMKCTIFAR